MTQTNTTKAGERTHKHQFSRSKPDATVETCTCGKFRHTEHSGPAIIEQQAQHTDAQTSNLRLIAAAPDLLAACKDFCDLLCLNNHPDIARQVREAQAAIAKAEGRAQ